MFGVMSTILGLFGDFLVFSISFRQISVGFGGGGCVFTLSYMIYGQLFCFFKGEFGTRKVLFLPFAPKKQRRCLKFEGAFVF